jgi:flagellar biosynthesis protein FlhA
MNGVSRFISGGTLVLIFITTVNVVGGILIGTRLHGEELSEAVKIYIPLSISAGCLFLVPILLISISAVIIVIRSVSEGKKWPD